MRFSATFISTNIFCKVHFTSIFFEICCILFYNSRENSFWICVKLRTSWFLEARSCLCDWCPTSKSWRLQDSSIPLNNKHHWFWHSFFAMHVWCFIADTLIKTLMLANKVYSTIKKLQIFGKGSPIIMISVVMEIFV